MRLKSTTLAGGGSVKCPNCRATPSAQHFRDNPECAKAAASIRAMLSVSQRKTNKAGPGRPKKDARRDEREKGREM